MATLDELPYTVKIKDNKLIMRSGLDNQTKLRFYKVFSVDTVDNSIRIEYYMKNEGTASQLWAPWEVTRVPVKGLVFFAKGEGSIWGNMSASATTASGCYWYNQEDNNRAGSKFFCDGKGWLAYVYEGRLFIKAFPDILKIESAPEEAEIEVYTGSYTELENQGVYSFINRKDSVKWEVKWYARTVPNEIQVVKGEPRLIDFVKSVIDSAFVSNQETITKNEIKVSPNPATDFLLLQFSEKPPAKTDLLIYDVTGNLVRKHHISSASSRIDIGEIKDGYYIYRIVSNERLMAKGGIIKSK